MTSSVPFTSRSTDNLRSTNKIFAQAGKSLGTNSIATHGALIWIIFTVLFGLFVIYFDNTVLVTTNGLWKSLLVKRWADSPPSGLDFSNFLYYPITGTLTHLMPEPFGPIYRRMAFLNAGWAGLALSSTYVIVRTLGLSSGAGLAAVLFQSSCAFFFELSVMNEDDMGNYAPMMASFAIAIWSFNRRDTRGIIGVAVAALLFDLSWLMEWRVLIPMAPAVGLALLLACGSWRQRVLRIVIFTVTAVSMPVLLAGLLFVALLITGKSLDGFHNPSLLDLISGLFWTGKALDSGYAGFAWNKWLLFLAGITEYWMGGRNMGSLVEIVQTRELIFALGKLVFILVVGAVFAAQISMNREKPIWRTAGAILGGTFIAGEVMNLYSQPQDPQMQLTAMPWFAVGWAMVAGLMRVYRWPLVRQVIPCLLPALFVWVNVWNTDTGLALLRGGDSAAQAQVVGITQQVDLASTVLVFNGFEGTITWFAADFGWDYPPELVSAPQEQPKVKLYRLLDDAVFAPSRTPEQSAKDVIANIDDILARGFRPVINATWAYNEAEFIDSFATVSEDAKPRAIYRALHTRYAATERFSVAGLGSFYELRPVTQGTTP